MRRSRKNRQTSIFFKGGYSEEGANIFSYRWYPLPALDLGNSQPQAASDPKRESPKIELSLSDSLNAFPFVPLGGKSVPAPYVKSIRKKCRPLLKRPRARLRPRPRPSSSTLDTDIPSSAKPMDLDEHEADDDISIGNANRNNIPGLLESSEHEVEEDLQPVSLGLEPVEGSPSPVSKYTRTDQVQENDVNENLADNYIGASSVDVSML